MYSIYEGPLTLQLITLCNFQEAALGMHSNRFAGGFCSKEEPINTNQMNGKKGGVGPEVGGGDREIPEPEQDGGLSVKKYPFINVYTIRDTLTRYRQGPSETGEAPSMMP